MQQPEERDEVAELGVRRLVMPDDHAEQSARTAAEGRYSQQQPLGRPPSAALRQPLIYSVDDEGQQPHQCIEEHEG